VSRLCDREAASAVADGLDSGRASATLLLSGECPLGPGLHARSESVTDIVLVSGQMLGGLLDPV